MAQQTFDDAVQRLATRFQFQASTSQSTIALMRARDAVRSAYRDLPNKYQWGYLRRRARISTNAAYSTGTIGIVASTRTVTLTSGTWPTWAVYGELVVGTAVYKPQSVSGATMILTADRCPASNVASGTSYQIQRTTYPLPADFRSLNDMFEVSSGFQPAYVPISDVARLAAWWYTAGMPLQYTVMGSQPEYPGRFTMQLSPAPDTDRAYDIIYESAGRPLGLRQVYSTGTASITAAGTTITGSGTVFPSNCEGCVIRLSANATDLPTGAWGANPCSYEGYITSRVSDTSVTVDTAAASTLSGVRLTIDDPIDIDQTTMQAAFDLLCQAYYADLAQLQSANDAMAKFRVELQRARAADDKDDRRTGGYMDPSTLIFAPFYGGRQ